MKIRKTFDYTNVFKYLSLLLFYLFISAIKIPMGIFSTAVLSASVALGFNFILSPLLYLLSIVIVGNVGLLLPAVIPAVFFLIIFFFYKLKKRKIGAEIFIYTLISLSGYIILGDGTPSLSLTVKITDTVITALISLVLYVGGNALLKKGLKFKLGYEELLTLFITVALIGLGVSNLISPHVWKGVSVVLLLICCFVYKLGTGTLIAVVFGTSLSIYYGNVNYVSLYLIWAIAIESLMPFSRYASALLFIAVDYGAHMLFGVYGTYGLYESLSSIIGAVFFCLIPKRVLYSLKEKISLFKEKQLIRQTINRNRVMTANRLYELSNVFLEISSSFTLFNEKSLTDDKVKSAMEKEISKSVCAECNNYLYCQGKNFPKKSDVNKMLSIGLAKGKLSFIDVPGDLASKCIHVSDMIFAVNKMLAEWRTKAIDQMNLNSGREILSGGAKGVSEILSGLAFECGSQLKYQSAIEKLLNENLYKAGFNVSELLCYGEKSDLKIGLVVTMKEFSAQALLRIIVKTVGMDMAISDKSQITDDKCYLFFTKSAKFDAVFGISSAKKDGSNVSGDTHAVSRISQDRFLIALSDGMGSGEMAESISSASLSLIESFYKAGLSTPLILRTVNKLLSVNSDDVFTALDVAVIDLANAQADFIKYGAPYGFIISDKTVRIVEGSSLPMGILSDLKPAVCQAELVDGDVVLLVTDGITDAFGSASDLLEFLQTLPALNPQTLTDCLLKRAIDLLDGKKKDDMTALAVRIFKKESLLEH